jgi:hypothetical protein
VSGVPVHVLRRIYPYLYRSMPVLFGGLYGHDAGRRSGRVRRETQNIRGLQAKVMLLVIDLIESILSR